MLILFAAAIAGMAAHWYARYAGQRTRATFAMYFFVNERKSSLASASLALGSLAAILSTWGGAVDVQTVATAFLAGYTADSVANRG